MESGTFLFKVLPIKFLQILTEYMTVLNMNLETESQAFRLAVNIVMSYFSMIPSPSSLHDNRAKFSNRQNTIVRNLCCQTNTF